MALVIEVFNADGSMQSVSLHSQVRAEEVVNAIARRKGAADASYYSLYRVIVWREAEGDTLHGPNLDRILTRIDLQPLSPDDRPLKVRTQCEEMIEKATRSSWKPPTQDQGKDDSSNKTRRYVINASIGFAFLNAEGELQFRERGEEIIARKSNGGVKTNSNNKKTAAEGNGDHSAWTSGWERMRRTEFAPINSLGKGEKSGFLFQRSAVNPREWQRRWCILRKDELIHCLSNLDHSDAKFVKLTHNQVRPTEPQSLGGLKHCFEIDTPHDVLQFRAKTEEEAKAWIESIQRNILLSSENEKFHLAERMIEDGQKSICNKDETLVTSALGSLQGLLSTHAGADRLFRFAKRNSLGAVGERNGEMVAFYLDLERAKAAFSSIPPDAGDPNVSAGEDIMTAPSTGSFKQRTSLKYLPSSHSVASSSGSSATGSTLRGSAAMLSRKEWMIQICERFLALFETVLIEEHDEGDVDLAQKLLIEDLESVKSLVKAADSLRKELVDESLRFIPRESCLVVVEEASKIVLHSIEKGLYKEFLSDEEYFRIVASIPSRIRSR